MKDHIRTEFDRIHMPQSCSARIRQSIEEAQPVHRKKLRILPKALIAAAAIMCLLVSAAAVGIRAGWLDAFLGSSEVQDVKELQLTAQDGEIEVTLDRMLTDGPFIYLQVSARTQGDVNAADAFKRGSGLPECGIEERLYTIYAKGNILLPLSERGRAMVGTSGLSSEGPAGTWHITRLDDGSDRNYCSYTMQIILGELPANYEGLELTLRLDQQRAWTRSEGGLYTTDEKATALIEETIVLTDAKAKITTLEDGRQVKLHSLGVQIQGCDFAVCDENAKWNSGVVLKDGTKLPFTPGWGTQDYFAEEMQWSHCPLNKVIDPNDVASIYAGDAIYPVN